jgi:hypothetical protein
MGVRSSRPQPYRSIMDPIIKQTLNALRCPICQGQIDSYPYRDYDFACVLNHEHYQIALPHDSLPFPQIRGEKVVIYERQLQYTVKQVYLTIGQLGIPRNITTITVRSVDPEFRVIETKEPSKSSTFHQKLFDFANTNKEKIINRVKTILVFQ